MKNLPALFERHSNLYFLPLSSQTRDQLLSSPPLQQVSTPANKLLRLASPNLIQEVSPLHLSQNAPYQLSSYVVNQKLKRFGLHNKPSSSTPKAFLHPSMSTNLSMQAQEDEVLENGIQTIHNEYL